MTVAALFVRPDSIYKQLAGVDAYDVERDAQTWPGGCAVVAHPPCGQWGMLSHMARENPAEKALAFWAVLQVREHGGVLEHPKGSKLWFTANLPAPGAPIDEWGGWTMAVSQKWFGHAAEKSTLLYIVGLNPAEVPPIPYVMGEAGATCGISGRARNGVRSKRRPEMAKDARDATPPAFAAWLVELAGRCQCLSAS